jgi:hypothetical protein
LLPPRRTAHFVGLPKELRIFLIAGMLEAGGEQRFNSAVPAVALFTPPHAHPGKLVADQVRLT